MLVFRIITKGDDKVMSPSFLDSFFKFEGE